VSSARKAMSSAKAMATTVIRMSASADVPISVGRTSSFHRQ
jgi:hypothetical protein